MSRGNKKFQTTENERRKCQWQKIFLNHCHICGSENIANVSFSKKIEVDMSKITRRKPYSKCLKIYSGNEFKVWSSLIGTEKPPGLVHVRASQARTGCSEHLIRIRTNSSPEALTVYHIFTSLSRGLKIFYLQRRTKVQCRCRNTFKPMWNYILVIPRV